MERAQTLQADKFGLHCDSNLITVRASAFLSLSVVIYKIEQVSISQGYGEE